MREDRDRLDLLGLDLRQGGGAEVAHVIEPARHQIGARRATIGHVRDRDADRRIEQQAGDVAAGTRAARAELQLGLVRLGIGDELMKIAGGEIRTGDQDGRRERDQADRGEIGRGIVGRVFVERLILRQHAGGSEQERVAVRGRARDPCRPGDAASAGNILDHHLHAEALAHPRRNDACDHVGRAAGGVGHHHRDRSGRPLLRGGRRVGREQCRRGCHGS